MHEPLVLIGVPKVTMDLLNLIGKKIGKSMVEVLSSAIEEKAKKHLKPEDFPRGT